MGRSVSIVSLCSARSFFLKQNGAGRCAGKSTLQIDRILGGDVPEMRAKVGAVTWLNLLDLGM
jgi:hypothetical protein